MDYVVSLLWPTDLLFVLVAPVLLVIYALFQRRRQRYALRYSNIGLVREAVGSGPGTRRHIPPALFITAIAVLGFASTRPQAVVTIPSEEGTVILAMDVSGSMLADDLKPTRLDAAKAAARAFVEQQGPAVQIGVVSFSSASAIVQAPTTDKALAVAAINRLQPQTATGVGRGILTSL